MKNEKKITSIVEKCLLTKSYLFIRMKFEKYLGNRYTLPTLPFYFARTFLYFSNINSIRLVIINSNQLL